jgi:hypothetical protein
MRPIHPIAGARERGTSHWIARRAGLPRWSVLVALGLAVPWWSWGQSNALDKATPPAGALVRVGPLDPGQMAEVKGRPLCVYTFTSW